MSHARHYQEGGPPESFELGHVLLSKRDGAEDGEIAGFQSNRCHAPGQLEQRHLQLANDGDDAFVHAREFAVREHGPFLEWCGHASIFRSGLIRHV